MSIQQRIQELLEGHPALRCSHNRLVFGYWVLVDGYGTREKDFDKLTSVETILREARIVCARHPELSPLGNPLELSETYISDLFPGLQHA